MCFDKSKMSKCICGYKKGHKRVVLNNMSIGNLDGIVCDMSIVNLEKIVLFNMSIEDLYRILFNI
jgi:hypothetical protein